MEILSRHYLLQGYNREEGHKRETFDLQSSGLMIWIKTTNDEHNTTVQ